jgi:hypothetical protein
MATTAEHGMLRTEVDYAWPAIFRPAYEVKLVYLTGRHKEDARISDAGEERTFRFCPDCGATVFWTTEGWPDSIAVAIGAFADPSFPQPTVSVYESRRYPWLSLPDWIEEEHD